MSESRELQADSPLVPVTIHSPSSERHMRILIYSINYAPELVGIGKFTGEMAEWLAEESHEVRVVTTPPYYPEWKIQKGYRKWFYQAQRLRGVQVVRCPLWVKQRLSGWQRLLHLVSFVISSFPIMLRQIPWQPDVVMVIEPSFFCLPTALLVARLTKARSWLHIQDFEIDAGFGLGMVPNYWALQKVLLLAERYLMNQFHQISTLSNQMIDRLVSKGIEPHKIMLFPNWVDTSEIYPLANPKTLRSDLSLQEDDVVVLYAGTMANKQNLELLLHAAARLRQQSNLHFLIAGEGPRKESLEGLAKLLNLKNVQFLPLLPIREYNRLLSTADIHILMQMSALADLMMPSKLTAMMASGRSILATATAESAIGQELLNAKAGILVYPDDLDQFVAAIQLLVRDTHQRQVYGTNGRHYAEIHFSKTEILKRIHSRLTDTFLPLSQSPSREIETTLNI
jgi:colanic acid biosynthesis glycosyl transferase WcaI